jgi:hypothetical protein
VVFWRLGAIRPAFTGQGACPPPCTSGDVLLHTVTDAILGALCLPDIGEPHEAAAPGPGGGIVSAVLLGTLLVWRETCNALQAACCACS